MPTEYISPGPPVQLVQNRVYALPALQAWIVSDTALEFSMKPDTGFAAQAASTTGMNSAWPFCRCTTANAIVVVKTD